MDKAMMKKMADYDYGIKGQQKQEMENTYKELETIVNRIKRALAQLNGFGAYYAPFKNIYNIIAPNTEVTSILGRLNLRKFFNILFAIIGSLASVFIGLPLISGFVKIPWSEMAAILTCMLIAWGIGYVRFKFKLMAP